MNFIENGIKLFCGGCGNNIENLDLLKGDKRKLCPSCGYSLFMFIQNTNSKEDNYEIPDLKERQKEIIIYVKEKIKNQDDKPSPKEIQEALKFKSIATVYYHLKILKEKGYITYKEGSLYSFKLLPKAMADETLLCLSDKQCELLKLIYDYITKTDKHPTIQELQKELGFQSVATLVYHLKRLQDNGLIEKSRYKHRSLKLTVQGEKILNTILSQRLTEK